MAIDTSIYSQIQPVQIESPINALAKVTQLQGAQNQNRLAQLQVQQADRANAQQEAISNAYRDNIDPTTGSINRTGLIGGLASSGQGAAIPGIQKTFSEQDKATRDAEKAGLEAAIQKQGLIAQYAGSAKDQASWTAAKQALSGMGVDVSQVPDQFDPNTAQTLLQRSLTGVQQLEQHWKQKGFDLDVARLGETQRSNRVSEGIAGGNLILRRQELAQGKVPSGYRANPDGSLSAIPGGPADAKLSKEGMQKTNDAKDVIGLLNEVDELLPKATSGAIGAGIDAAAGAFGHSPEGATATAQLKAIQGALISKMPKMSGPQSDKDVQLYREMAGQVADPLVPRQQRQAASATIRKLNERYAGMDEGSSKPLAGAPKVGHVEGGYRFKGGDPTDKNNWVKQ